MKEVKPISNLNTLVRIPGSKSITHRALIASSLAKGESRLEDFLSCEDTLITADGLRQAGVSISFENTIAKVSGLGGIFPPAGRGEIFLGNSGTSYRLLLSTIALGGREFNLAGTSRMEERPIGDLVTALNRLGANIEHIKKDGYPPVRVKGEGLLGGSVKIPGNKSSQFISSLLLAAPYAKKDVEIEIIGDLVSRPYIDLTLDVMESFGISAGNDDYKVFHVKAGDIYKPCSFQVDGDVSTASYFWAAAAVTGGRVITENIRPASTRQGDISLLDIMEEMGCKVDRAHDRVSIEGDSLSGIEIDMNKMPDMVPTLSAIALFADGKTSIRNVHHLRIKESDRLHSIAQEWNRLGARVEELPDGLIIHGGHELNGAKVDSHNDHRIAMSLAVIGLKVPGIIIKDEQCVSKSFPGFWKLWDALRQTDPTT